MIRLRTILEACWKTHKQIGMKKKGGKLVPDCVPKNEDVLPTDQMVSDDLIEAMSSTERGRLYRKRHPKKVREYLRKTQADRVIRNRDRRRAIKRHGENVVKKHDIHHPSGVGGPWRLARKDHGRDYVKEKAGRSKYR